jgi:hypothetical protein
MDQDPPDNETDYSDNSTSDNSYDETQTSQNEEDGCEHTNGWFGDLIYDFLKETGLLPGSRWMDGGP